MEVSFDTTPKPARETHALPNHPCGLVRDAGVGRGLGVGAGWA